VGHEVDAKGICCSLRPAGHDVPGDSTLGQVVQATECPREGKGRNVACTSSDAKTDRSRCCLDNGILLD
jgi:hypothetical protein